MTEEERKLTAKGGGSDVQREVEQIIAAAERLGVEVDEFDAVQWLTAMAAASERADDLAVDEEVGVYGHRVSLIDFSPEELARYRRIAAIVEIPDRPGVETAISLSGSAAQSQVQRYPGDCDYFERVNIQAPTRQAACALLAEVMRDKALSRLRGPNYQLVEVKFGTYLADVIKRGRRIKAGAPISWAPDEVEAGGFEVYTPEGEEMLVDWAYAQQEPGWCKLDWVIAEPDKGRVVSVSNMLDVTWEAPDGSIIPLDGFLDPYFQEVYLDAESIPLFTKLIKHISPQALDDYVAQLEEQVRHYAVEPPPNYGKAAKRMYNIFRLTGRHREAMFIRELFDEPAACLYQVWSLIDTIEEALDSGAELDRRAMVKQTDSLIRSVVDISEGPGEGEIVSALLRLRDNLTGWEELDPSERSAVVAESQAQLIRQTNEFFGSRLMALPEIANYLEGLQT